MSCGYSLRSGGYALRSKGSSPIQFDFPDPPKSRSRGKVAVSLGSPPNKRFKSKSDQDEGCERYMAYLARTRQRKFLIPRSAVFHNNHVKSSIPEEKTEAKAKAEAVTITDPEDHFFGYGTTRFWTSSQSVVLELEWEPFRRKSEEMKKLAEDLAAEAISYLRKRGTEWKLVKPCMYQGDPITTCFMLHVNFQAKSLDDPKYPVQTFFAQVRYHQKHVKFQVDCCVRLGASDSMPERRENEGCLYCSKFVHHPRGGLGGWSNGWPNHRKKA